MESTPKKLTVDRGHMDKSILHYYEEFDESARLQGDSIERLRTQEIITRDMSDSPQMILDVGGAAGVYSFWLSKLGHYVHLLDASKKHIEMAKEESRKSTHPLASIAIGGRKGYGRCLRLSG
jgi:2-polyprenyl-3-methyl-5-hydroxy-6-metoxy-1,4-benzoquinol methylase